MSRVQSTDEVIEEYQEFLRANITDESFAVVVMIVNHPSGDVVFKNCFTPGAVDRDHDRAELVRCFESAITSHE